MVLIVAVVAGLVATLLRAGIRHRQLEVPNLKWVWLVVVAFLFQAIVFQMPTRSIVSDNLAAVVLIFSQFMLLLFAWGNRQLRPVWVLGLGLIMNLLVIGLNGGLMPITPETVQRLAPNAPESSWQVNRRLGTGKDIVLQAADMRLGWLSDRFLPPTWLPYHVAFSIGDVFIAIGAFWLLWSFSDPNQT